MKSWQIAEHYKEGGPEVARVVELPKPVPQAGEALIRVQAVGLNHLDLWLRKGVPGHQFPLPLVPGSDSSGVIEALGSDCGDRLKVGDGVIVNPGIGLNPLSADYGILGEDRDGACREYLCISVNNLIARPRGVTPEQAAALPVPYLTARAMLRKAELKNGELILIQAGGSGVSIAATQLAKRAGATVITTVGSADKAERSRAAGADHVILYRDKPFRPEVRKITEALGRKGCDVVVDHVGAETFNDSLKCLVRGGRLVTCGATSGGEVKIDLKLVFFKSLSILGSTMGRPEDLEQVTQYVARGELAPVIDSVFSMDDLPKAYARLASREAFGKVIVKGWGT